MRYHQPRPASRRPLLAALGSLLLAAAPVAAPSQTAPRPAGAAKPLARYVPRDPTFYAEFEGLDAHAEGWRATAARKVLNETTLGALITDLAKQGVEAARKQAKGKGPTPDQLKALVNHLVAKGFAAGFTGKGPEDGILVVAVRGGASSGFQKALLDMAAGADAAPKEVTRAGRKVSVFGPEGDAHAVWDEQGDTLYCPEKCLDRVLAVIDGKAPSAEADPTRAALAKAGGGFEPVGYAYLDVARLPEMPENAKKAGLGGLKRVELRWGFQGDALMTVLRAVAPGPRRGALGLLDQPTFGLASLPPVPSGLTHFTAFSLAPAPTYDRVVALAKANDPKAGEAVAAHEQEVREAVGLDLRRDILAHFGPKFAVYDAPVAGAPPVPFVNTVVTAQVDDQAAAGKALDQVMRLINERLKTFQFPNRPDGQPLQFTRVEGDRPTYKMIPPEGLLPPGPMWGIEPTVILGPNTLVIATRPSAAEAALEPIEGRGAKWSAQGPYRPLANRLGDDLVFLSIYDPRETLPQLVGALPFMVRAIDQQMKQAARGNPNAPQGLPIRIDPNLVPAPQDLARYLAPGSFSIATDDQGVQIVTRDSFPNLTSPGGTGVMIALLLPAVQAAREAARRAQCVNNLKQIGLAMHNYESANGRFPAAAVTDKQGKPLLSWRVAILPYIEQNTLYQKFHLDEPWDSPHNKELLKEMPPTYACPSASRPDPTAAYYRVFTGNGALFDVAEGSRLAAVTDGTVNTLMVVETREGVPWTKPEDLPFDPKADHPTFGAGSFHPGGFNALFADASVRFLKLTVKPEVIRKLITKAGNEVINPADY